MGGNFLLVMGFVIVAMIGGGYYITQREGQAASLGTITSLSQIDGLAPISCSLQPGQIGTGGGGYMYIDNDRIRVSLSDLTIPGYSGDMEAVLGTDKTLQIAAQSLPANVSYSKAEQVLNTVITSSEWRCSPWWFPNSSLFNIPNAATP